MTTYTYDNDSLNRVTSYTDSKGNTIEYEYDGNSNLTKLIYPDNKIVRYSYNANNQLAKVQDWANRITIYDYYENGNLKSESRPDGSIQTYTYNEIGQLIQTVDKAQDGTIINEYSYEYDADGNVITENSLYEPDYDNVTIPDSKMLYGKGNQLTEFNETAVMYDLDGNMLNTPLGNKWGLLTYNSQNMLTDIVTSDSAISFEYDAEGYRIAKIENSVATNFVVNPNAELSQVLMSEKDGETTYYIYGLGLIAQENSEGYKTYHYDYRGSTTAITDENGIVTDRVYYDIYGNILSQTGTTNTPYLYVGQYGVETDDCGLYYMRARYYNPTIQRFVNIDPIRDELNWYSYCNDNAISNVDFTGKNPAILWILYAYATAVLTSPDLEMDMQFIAMDIANNDYGAAVLDGIGVLIPGVSGVGQVAPKAIGKVGKSLSSVRRYLGKFSNEAIDLTVMEIKNPNIRKVVGDLWFNVIDAPSSRKLRKQMIKAGVEVPDFKNEAHHIVAGTSEYAKKSREILAKYGVSINNAVNGVFLPIKEGISDSIIHSKTFGVSYYKKVEELLAKADSREEVLEILDEIKEQLLDGSFFDN